jgi:CBS domain containing-hemolysin-like protein
VLEEIVGDIRDEFDIEHGPIFEMNEQFIVISGALTMRELQAETGWTFEWQPKETVALWTQRHFGRLPKRGEAVKVGDYQVTVIDVHAERVRRVKVQRLAPAVE